MHANENPTEKEAPVLNQRFRTFFRRLFFFSQGTFFFPHTPFLFFFPHHNCQDSSVRGVPRTGPEPNVPTHRSLGMDVCCSFCHRPLHRTASWRVLPCGHMSCTDCDANALRFFNMSGFDTTALDSVAARAFCPICSVPDEDDEDDEAGFRDASTFSPLLMPPQQQQLQGSIPALPMLSALPGVQPQQAPPLGCLDNMPCFVPQYPLHTAAPFNPLHTTTTTIEPTGRLPLGLSLASDVPGCFGNNKRDGVIAQNENVPQLPLQPRQQPRAHTKHNEFDRYLKQAAQVQENVNVAKRELQTQVSGIFAQITKLIVEREATVNRAIEEKFDELANRLGEHEKALTRLVSQGPDARQGGGVRSPKDTEEARKTIEELSTTVTEAKAMLRKVKNLDFSSEIHSLQELISSVGEKDGLFSSFTEYLRSNNGSAQFEAVIDATLSKPMIRSWSDSVSQSAVLITWTTPRDFEFTHRAEGFWYELEQRMAAEPDTAWHNVYKGVERTYVGKGMESGTTYLFRCRVCVARHRFSLWSPEVAITPGTGDPDGRQNMVAPEISKALEQEVARSFASGAASGTGSAAQTQAVTPVGSSTPKQAQTEQQQQQPQQQQQQPPFSVHHTPSSPRVPTQGPVGIQTSPKPPAPQSLPPGSPDVAAPRGRRLRVLPDLWCSFVPDASCELSQGNKAATALRAGAVAAGHPLPKNSTTTVIFQLLRGTGLLVGVAPVFPGQSHPGQVLHSGWFVAIGTSPPHIVPTGERPDSTQPNYHPDARSKPPPLLREGETVSLVYNTRASTVRVVTPHGACTPGDIPGITAPLPRTTLVPVVVFATPGDTVCLLTATQASYT